MDDDSSKSLRDRLDALLRRARQISAEIERRVDEVTAEPAGGPEVESQQQQALSVASKAVAVSAEAAAVSAQAAAVTAEALSVAAGEKADGAAPIPEAPPGAPTTVIPEAAVAAAADPAPSPAAAAPSAPSTPSPSDAPDEPES